MFSFHETDTPLISISQRLSAVSEIARCSSCRETRDGDCTEDGKFCIINFKISLLKKEMGHGRWFIVCEMKYLKFKICSASSFQGSDFPFLEETELLVGNTWPLKLTDLSSKGKISLKCKGKVWKQWALMWLWLYYVLWFINKQDNGFTDFWSHACTRAEQKKNDPDWIRGCRAGNYTGSLFLYRVPLRSLV